MAWVQRSRLQARSPKHPDLENSNGVGEQTVVNVVNVVLQGCPPPSSFHQTISSTSKGLETAPSRLPGMKRTTQKILVVVYLRGRCNSDLCAVDAILAFARSKGRAVTVVSTFWVSSLLRPHNGCAKTVKQSVPSPQILVCDFWDSPGT